MRKVLLGALALALVAGLLPAQPSDGDLIVGQFRDPNTPGSYGPGSILGVDQRLEVLRRDDTFPDLGWALQLGKAPVVQAQPVPQAQREIQGLQGQPALPVQPVLLALRALPVLQAQRVQPALPALRVLPVLLVK